VLRDRVEEQGKYCGNEFPIGYSLMELLSEVQGLIAAGITHVLLRFLAISGQLIYPGHFL